MSSTMRISSCCSSAPCLSRYSRRGLAVRTLAPATTPFSATAHAPKPSHHIHVCHAKATNKETAAAAATGERQINILLLNRTVGARTYLLLELVVLLVQLGLLDAAYSGDWSRIGIISKELEGQLQLLVNFIVVAHGSLSVVAFFLAQGRPGRNPAVVALQTFLFGTMAIYELLQDDASQST